MNARPAARSARTVTAGGPRKDEQGRVLSLAQLVGASLAYWAINVVGLVIIDALLSWTGSTSFGDSSGWLTLILPGLLFFEDFRAWRAHPRRVLVLVVAALVAVALGVLVAGMGNALVPLLSGGLAALVTLLAFAVVWFVGIRYVTGDWVQEK